MHSNDITSNKIIKILQNSILLINTLSHLQQTTTLLKMSELQSTQNETSKKGGVWNDSRSRLFEFSNVNKQWSLFTARQL